MQDYNQQYYFNQQNVPPQGPPPPYPNYIPNPQNEVPPQEGYPQNYPPQQNMYPQEQYPQQNYYNYPPSPLLINEEREKAKKLVVSWIICVGVAIGIPIFSYVLVALMTSLNSGTVSAITSALMVLINSISTLSGLASQVIIIVAKVKYPKDSRVNTAFIIDMVMVGLSILVTILGCIFLGVFCGAMANDCG